MRLICRVGAEAALLDDVSEAIARGVAHDGGHPYGRLAPGDVDAAGQKRVAHPGRRAKQAVAKRARLGAENVLQVSNRRGRRPSRAPPAGAPARSPPAAIATRARAPPRARVDAPESEARTGWPCRARRTRGPPSACCWSARWSRPRLGRASTIAPPRRLRRRGASRSTTRGAHAPRITLKSASTRIGSFRSSGSCVGEPRSAKLGAGRVVAVTSRGAALSGRALAISVLERSP